MTSRRHRTAGLNRVYQSLTERMRLVSNTSFWSKLGATVFKRDPKTGRLSAARLAKGVCSLSCVVSLFPLVAIFPPLYSWNRKYWPRAFVYFLMSAPTIAISIFLMIVSLKIYVVFFIFTLTSALFHYQNILGIVSIVAGCLGFVFSTHSQINNAYLGDKLFILDVINEVHGAKIQEHEVERNRIIGQNEKRFNRRVYVPELVWWWKRENWSCIPEKLYGDITAELRPISRERAKILVKVFVLGIFVSFVLTVMDALGMNDHNAQINSASWLISVVAVTVPSIIGNLRSAHLESINSMQKRGKVKAAIERFLKRNQIYYKYDFVDVTEQAERDGHPANQFDVQPCLMSRI